MSGASILGLGMCVPDGVLTNADLEARLDTTDEWIRTRTGIAERRIAAEGEATSTFATAAGAEATKDAGLLPDDLDLVLVSTCTPDHPVPGSAPLVQSSLGAGRAGAFDLNAGCTGFVYGLSVASSFVDAGTASNVLLCGAETLSRIVDPDDRTTAVLFGDGAGAVVVGRSADGRSRIGPFVFGCDGARADWLWVPAGGSAMPTTHATLDAGDHLVHMNGQDVYKHACDRMTEAAREVLGDRSLDDIDLVVAHQANARIVRTVAQRLGLKDDQVVDTIAGYGNNSAASIPIALAESVASGRLTDGMTVLLVAFGAGFSWASCLVEWGSE
jgi:3-oxoacyl-[acyl-carrier-protein] synthase-3